MKNDELERVNHEFQYSIKIYFALFPPFLFSYLFLFLLFHPDVLSFVVLLEMTLWWHVLGVVVPECELELMIKEIKKISY